MWGKVGRNGAKCIPSSRCQAQNFSGDFIYTQNPKVYHHPSHIVNHKIQAFLHLTFIPPPLHHMSHMKLITLHQHGKLVIVNTETINYITVASVHAAPIKSFIYCNGGYIGTDESQDDIQQKILVAEGLSWGQKNQ